jgi:alcohol dehydrogenase (cytochrome c)
MSTLRRTLPTACMLCLFTLLGSSAGAQVADGDWLTYNRTLAGDRFSPLKEINRANVAQLKALCAYTLPKVSSLQTGPLVIDGTMYFTTDEGSYAIDASTCAEKWKYHRHSDTPSMLLVNRGFAYANGRLFRGTSDSHGGQSKEKIVSGAQQTFTERSLGRPAGPCQRSHRQFNFTV